MNRNIPMQYSYCTGFKKKKKKPYSTQLFECKCLSNLKPNIIEYCSMADKCFITKQI